MNYSEISLIYTVSSQLIEEERPPTSSPMAKIVKGKLCFFSTIVFAPFSAGVLNSVYVTCSVRSSASGVLFGFF